MRVSLSNKKDIPQYPRKHQHHRSLICSVIDFSVLGMNSSAPCIIRTTLIIKFYSLFSFRDRFAYFTNFLLFRLYPGIR